MSEKFNINAYDELVISIYSVMLHNTKVTRSNRVDEEYDKKYR